MKILANKDNRYFIYRIIFCMAGFLFVTQVSVYILYKELSDVLFLLFFLAALSVLGICFSHFNRQERIMESAVSKMDAFLSGDTDVRIACDEEGTLYKLFHSVNTLASILNAHIEKELQEKEFLQHTISDISHQLKTPLAALNVYIGLILEEAKEQNREAFEKGTGVEEFAALSEKELDRIDILIQNLLKMAKLDAGMIVCEKTPENVFDMMQDVALHFRYRAKEEEKEILLSGAEDQILFCDRDWLMEAVGNLVKNALDHMKAGDRVQISWREGAASVQISIADNGSGIAPEDMPHIFKRFYRSSRVKDTPGIGLGLPLAKAIVTAHNGIMEVDSEWGKGTVFMITFLTDKKDNFVV